MFCPGFWCPRPWDDTEENVQEFGSVRRNFKFPPISPHFISIVLDTKSWTEHQHRQSFFKKIKIKNNKKLQFHDWEKPQFREGKKYFIYTIENKRHLSNKRRMIVYIDTDLLDVSLIVT